ELYQLAHEELNNATDYYQFTKLIAAYFSQPQKIKMIELLWQVAYADNHLDAYEEHMVRRIADLIYVPHHDFIQTKLRVQKKQS
ncbi:MAG: TerB family tellurite resistance protein, partial [gamma proteobacterium symbiont of Bathyaustriella thionipta]|nr:TerB family tellurite resistance protein [gamma proteobacterium symbiont of Bathyaustriella thionipta]